VNGKQIVVFGTGSFAENVAFYLTHDSPHEVVAFSVHGDHQENDTLASLPVIPFEEVATRYPPDAYGMFVAVGYSRVNRLRAELCAQAKDMGYELMTYVSSKATTWPGLEIGENCFVFEDNTIQPFVRIGDDCVLWSGNHVGHHASIGDHCFITSHVVISGHTRVGAYSFLGVNATLRDDITVGESNVIGAAAVIMKSTEEGEVYAPARTKPRDVASDKIGM
jgi:sugar O-acyltransferase (sialic acid O-acetyltransferase NeuD family)